MQSPLWKPANVNLTESPWSPSLCYCKHFAGGDHIFIFVNLLDPGVVANESVVCGRASFWFLCLDRGKKTSHSAIKVADHSSPRPGRDNCLTVISICLSVCLNRTWNTEISTWPFSVSISPLSSFSRVPQLLSFVFLPHWNSVSKSETWETMFNITTPISLITTVARSQENLSAPTTSKPSQTR